ncbi:MAG: hypothetical protein ACK51L_03005 [bacterium]
MTHAPTQSHAFFYFLCHNMDAASRQPKRITIGQRVSGSVGPLIANPDPSKKRKVRARLYGYIIEESGSKHYKVQFDDGQTLAVASNSLRIERAAANLPPSERPQPTSHAASSANDAGDISDPDEAEQEDERGDPQAEAADDEADPSDDEGRQESGGIYVGEDLPKNHHEKLIDARKRIQEMLGEKTTQGKFTWTVIAEHHADDLPEERFIGVKGIELHRADPAQIYSDLLLHIMFRDWRQSLKQMNAKITEHNESNTKALVPLFQDHEFITSLALMIGAACFSEQGIACCFV